jgi:two-component system, chemotaxis family, response regulator Rcp1
VSTDVTQISVLVVEDNEADAELVIEGLEHAAGVGVHVIGDRRSALDYLRTRHEADPHREPDLLLLDLNLPRLGGLETLAELKRDQNLRHIPVVVLTTSRSQREINDSYALGAAAVLNKPMRLAEHRQMMRNLAAFWFSDVRLPRQGI